MICRSSNSTKTSESVMLPRSEGLVPMWRRLPPGKNPNNQFHDMKIAFCAAALWVCAVNSQAIPADGELPASVATVASSNEPSAAPPSRSVAVADLPFPGEMECVPQPFYRHRADGMPGREIILNFKTEKLFGNAQVQVVVDGRAETTELPPVPGGTASCRVLLPAEVGMKREAQVGITLRRDARELKMTVKVPPMRHWTVYIYPHSHVDIGYTAPQKIIEFIHKRNIDEGIKLAEATKDYPLGSRYRWNPEITWPLERLWQTQPEQRPRVVKDKCMLTNGCKGGGTTLENQHLRVSLDPATGNITQLVNLASNQNFADVKVNGGLNAFRWLPANRDEPKADTDVTITTVESGPVVVELRVTSKATGCRSVTRSVRLVADQPWVEITNVVDKLPLVAKDGIHFGFGFDVPQGRTRVDIPWA